MYEKYKPLFNLLIFLILSLFSFIFFSAFKVILAPLLVSLLIAYFFDPSIKKIEKKFEIKRSVLSFILILSLVIVVTLLFVLLTPIVIEQFNNFSAKLPDLINSLSNSGSKISDWIDTHFKLPEDMKINFSKEMEKEILKILSKLSRIIPSIFSNIYSIIISIIYLILIPIFSFYMLKELPNIKAFIEKLIPPRMRAGVKEKAEELNDVVGAFLRGQLMISLILAVAYSIGLSIIKLPFAILIGIIAGLGDIVPYLGTLFGIILSIVVALFYYHSIKSIILVIIVFAVIKIVEDWLIYPKLIGERMGIHPFIIILIIIFAGEYFGITGMILAIPFAGALKIFLEDIYSWYLKSFIYNKEVEIQIEEDE